MQHPDEWVVVDRDGRIPVILAAGPTGAFTTRDAAQAAAAQISGARVERVIVVCSHDNQGRQRFGAAIAALRERLAPEKPADPKVDGASSQAAGFPSTS